MSAPVVWCEAGVHEPPGAVAMAETFQRWVRGRGWVDCRLCPWCAIEKCKAFAAKWPPYPDEEGA